MFFRILNGFFLLIIFFTGKVLAVQSGEIFWEIKKPGDNIPNYLMGTQHFMILNEKSLPPEVIDALKNTKVGLFEVISDDRGEEAVKEALKNNIKLPSGKTLSLLIGEEKARKLFSVLQPTLSNLDEDIVSPLTNLTNKLKDLGIDVTSYSDFNSLKLNVLIPLIDQVRLHQEEIDDETNGIMSFIYKAVRDFIDDHLVSVISSRSQYEEPDTELLETKFSSAESDNKTAQINQLDTSDKPDIQECLQQDRVMDIYIEKTLSCLGKPIYSLESVESQTAAALASISSDEILANLLNTSFDRLIASLEGRLNELESELEIKILKVTRYFQSKIFEGQIHLQKSYLQNSLTQATLFQSEYQKNISQFLNAKQCSALSKTSVEQFVDQIVNFSELFTQIFSTGKQIEREIEEKIKLSLKELRNHQRVLISSCFPDYKWPENQAELDQIEEELLLNSIKTQIEALLLSRDQKLAKKMLPYFEQGGIFAAVGFGHLSGVLEEFQAQGYEVKLIEFSTPLKEAE